MRRLSDQLRRLYWKVTDAKFVRRLEPHKLHRQWEEDHLRRLLRHYHVDCVFDVGANYGQYAQMLRRKANYTGLIVSFEPTPSAARSLRERAVGDKRWIIREQALSSHDGQQPFNIMRGSQSSSFSTATADVLPAVRDNTRVKESITVETQTLTTAYAELRRAHDFKRPFLKLDTQGYDTEIVKPSQAIMHNFIGLQSELAIKRLYESSVDYRDALTLYQQYGFELSAFVPNNEGFFPRLVEVDCIMVRADLLHD